MGLHEELRDFLVRDLGFTGDRDALTDDYPLIDNNVLDSQGIFEMVSMIEDRYRVEIEDEELLPENFETVGAIARLVESKRSS
jgi:acyl carrier protein